MKVVYIGKTNDFTYKKDLMRGSIGELKAIGVYNRDIICQVDFENGISASIDVQELRVVKYANNPFRWI